MRSFPRKLAPGTFSSTGHEFLLDRQNLRLHAGLWQKQLLVEGDAFDYLRLYVQRARRESDEKGEDCFVLEWLNEFYCDHFDSQRDAQLGQHVWLNRAGRQKRVIGHAPPAPCTGVYGATGYWR